MKYIATILTTALVAGFASHAFASNDEFGSHFTDQAPAALEDETTLTIEDVPPYLIEPAAGEQADEENNEMEDPSANTSEESETVVEESVE